MTLLSERLCTVVPEDLISTQMNLHSPGDVIYMLRDVYKFAKDNWAVIFGFLVLLGGGSAATFKVNGLIDIVKNIIAAPEELRAKKLDNDSKELDIEMKRLELHQKLTACGIDPETLEPPLRAVAESTTSLQAEPIIISESATPVTHADSGDEESSGTAAG